MSGAALCLLLAAPSPAAPIASTAFVHPRGDYTLTYPAGWTKRYGVQSLILRPAGKAGEGVRLRVELHGLPGEPSAEKFAAELKARQPGVRALVSEADASLGGRPAKRLEFTETKVLLGRYKTPLPGPLREVHFIVPLDRTHYYVVAWEGYGPAYERFRPDLEKAASGIAWGPRGASPAAGPEPPGK